MRDRGVLEAAPAQPYATFGGVDLYPDPAASAAALLESVVKNHPFVDGKKRAGYTLGRLTLFSYDLDLHATDEEEYEMVIQVANGSMDVDAIEAWVRALTVHLTL